MCECVVILVWRHPTLGRFRHIHGLGVWHKVLFKHWVYHFRIELWFIFWYLKLTIGIRAEFSIWELNRWSPLSINRLIEWFYNSRRTVFLSSIEFLILFIISSQFYVYSVYHPSCLLHHRKWTISHCLIWLIPSDLTQEFLLCFPRITKYGHFTWKIIFRG